VIGLKDRSYFDLPFIWSFNYGLVPMFFALSGFLIAGSANRLATLTFFGNRAARILPALGVEILLSALLLGPLVSTMDMRSYFSDSQLAEYFFNVIGNVQFELPGVVFDRPYPNLVNGPLWTVPIEMVCYATMGALLLLRLQRSYFRLPLRAQARINRRRSNAPPRSGMHHRWRACRRRRPDPPTRANTFRPDFLNSADNLRVQYARCFLPPCILPWQKRQSVIRLHGSRLSLS
jgi:hypothetical protein